jgi:restriction system protein
VAQRVHGAVGGADGLQRSLASRLVHRGALSPFRRPSHATISQRRGVSCAVVSAVEPDAVEEQLDHWLAFVLHGGPPDLQKPLYEFAMPSAEIADAYLRRLHKVSEDEVIRVLRHLLLPSGSLGSDRWHLEWLALRRSQEGLPPAMLRVTEFDRRLIAWTISKSRGDSAPPPWEGITWVLDLLPGFPQRVLDALSAYMVAHAQILPDGRYCGLSDALSIIRARYIGLPGSDVGERKRALIGLRPQDFERLIERYYNAKGYSTTLTAPQKDGGRDIIAWRKDVALNQRLLVECKNWERKVGVPRVREILGSVSHERATQGIIVATSGFTRPAKELATDNARIALLGDTELVMELNRVLGTNWPARLDRLLVESRTRAP